MDELLLPILIATTVALASWSIVRLAAGAWENEKRKLQERLTRSGGGESRSDTTSAITLHTEATGLSAVLVRWAPMQSLHRSLLQAYPEITLVRFLSFALILALMATMLVGLLMGSLLVGAVAGALAGYVPFLALSNRRFARQRALAEQLPEALDFLSRTLKAGHSLSTGLQMLGQELPQPLAAEFARCYDQHSLGLPLEEALKEMAARIESTDFAFFITAVLIQRQTGGDLSEVLTNISGMIRQRIRLQQHVKAKTAEGRLTGYVLVGFPALMFVISYAMNPEQAGVMLNTSTGLMLLGTTIVLQGLGLFSIRKITTVKV